ncbi:MAG: tetratricopeptide repeat protein [Anaerolineae bacterium]|nr:tetratricopeptide repeat protein [Anaerolineae bacterium]
MTECEQLEQAIAALEAQRAILGDAVVEAGLAPMRARLAELKSKSAATEQKRRQVTVLFADLSGFTTLFQSLDAEDVTEMVNDLWSRLDGAITSHGGVIDKHIGDCVMGIWSSDLAREDDPERAIHAALAMQSALATFREERRVVLFMRIGLSTGQAVLGEVGTRGEFTAMGDTVNLAARLEQVAPVGGILISHDTYRHVRGVFDVVPQTPLAVKGQPQLVRTYVVQRAKPRAFRMGARGIEGVETRMVGREAELQVLQNSFIRAVAQGVTRLVTVVGEAGIGKSRLLYEFENWIELRPEIVFYFKGRAFPALQHIPYGIFRDMFAFRFNILESDGAAVALRKFRKGMDGILSPERADLVGHLIGFDFSVSPAVQNLIGSPDFGPLAKAYLANYVRAMAEQRPMMMFLEDLHWADDSSLDLIEYLITNMPQTRLLIVGLARPTLFERRAGWGDVPSGAGAVANQRFELGLLSRRASQALVEEILQKVDAIPEALRDLIIEGAEGNPFYVEELVKMLIEEGVIDRGAGLRSPWRVNLDRLEEVHVPPTLMGILQARLDGLPRRERELLQRAAVVGRLFWDAAVAELAGMERQQLGAALDAACARELIFQREHSAFAGTEEYLFKHTLLHDVTYETVLLKVRRNYHAQVARWLEARAGERVGEYAGLIAEHLERAGEAEEAARYLGQAVGKALTTGAFREVLGLSGRALALLPGESPERAALLVQMGEALRKLGDYGSARRQLESGLVLARHLADQGCQADALAHLGSVAREKGDWALARGYLEQSLALARRVEDRARIARVLDNLGWVDFRQGAYREASARLTESQALYQALGDRTGLARVLNGLGAVANAMEDYGKSQALHLESLAISRETGDRWNESRALNNLGVDAWLRGEYARAQHYYREALNIVREIGYQANLASTLGNLGHVVAALGDRKAAVSYYHEALQITVKIGAVPIALESLAGLAGVLAQAGRVERALELLGAALYHPALVSESRELTVDPILATLRAQLSPEEVEAGLLRGRALPVEPLIEEILAQANDDHGAE